MSTLPTSEKSTTVSRQLRRLRLLISHGMFAPLPENSVCKRATTVDELREAYRLVHDIYVDQKYILPTESKMRVRAFEVSPDTATFITRFNGATVGVFSCIMDSPELRLPTDKVFPDELAQLRDAGAVLCEFSNQVILPECRSTSATTELMKIMFAHIWFHNITDAVCAVSPNQIEFFRLIGFTQIGDVKSYSDVVYDPVVLMQLPDVQNILGKPKRPGLALEEFRYQYFTADNPYMSIIPFWDAMVERLFANGAAVQSLFAECITEFEMLPYEEREAIAQYISLESGLLDSGRESYSDTVI
ncbi:MAG: hypothetical protein JXX14_15605 [Deltaproteobacteria bacterium]|nr:hypothetical protein [Deltaproteobacteria bacterium]